MARWSFGLRQLFLWTAVIALGLVALRSASTVWVAAMLALTVAALTLSLLLLIFRRGGQRAYWIGFAICGWMYLLLLLGSWTVGRNTTGGGPLHADRLITQQLSSGAYHWLYDRAFEKYHASLSMGSGGGYSPYGSSLYGAGADMYGSEGMAGDPGMMSGGMPGMPGAQPAPPGPDITEFNRVAHALWTLLFAAIGGLVAQWLYVTGPERSERPSSPPT